MSNRSRHRKQPLINDTIDLVDPLSFDRRRLAEVLQRRVALKGAGNRQQLDLDLHAVLKGLREGLDGR